MTAEERLREAIRTRTSEVEPSPPSESLRRIEQRLAAARQATFRRRLLVGLASAAAVLAVVAVAVTVARPGGDGDQLRTADQRTTTTSAPTTEPSTTTETSEPPSTTSTSTSSTSTSSTTTTTEAPAPAEVDPSVAVWPSTEGSQRFDDPVAAAESFAVDLVGFSGPIVGSFQADGERSGTVAVQATGGGPVTSVLVRQLEDDTWWVIASSTADISLDQPATGARVTCPLRLTGTALAFEGTVAVSLRDGSGAEIGSGFVTGGGDVARPFDGTIECSAGGGGYGTLILTETSAEDGSVVKALARRVAL